MSWVVDSNSNIPSLVNFDQENLDDEEIDWDEIDFKMGVPLKSTPNSASSPLKKKLVKTPINADKVTVTYPIRIPPFKSLNVNLTLGRNIPVLYH